MKKTATLVVIGGGAGGFFCAINAAAANPYLQVILLEKSAHLLSKVRISGGGRCNVTHACFDIDELSRKYPRGQHFVKKMLHQFSPTDTISWFQRRGVRLITEADGRMFPETHQSATIVNCLLKEADEHQVIVKVKQEVREVEKSPEGFTLTTTANEKYLADFICIATGGYPKVNQFSWLEKLGHTIEPPVPSLFTFNIPDPALRALMGISVNPVSIAIANTKMQEIGALLITHWGLSGPAILKLSAFAARHLAEQQYRGTLIINWMPDYHETSLRNAWQHWRQEKAALKIGVHPPIAFPARLWMYFLSKASIDADKRWGDLSTSEQHTCIRLLTHSEYHFQGKTTFKEEFVTCGGISLREVDANTMQSKKVAGLYFCGEVLDIDGITGGFNFQQSWSGGWIAAQAIAQEAEKKATKISGF
jgi:predicted Rossmann fold flavoprotein